MSTVRPRPLAGIPGKALLASAASVALMAGVACSDSSSSTKSGSGGAGGAASGGATGSGGASTGGQSGGSGSGGSGASGSGGGGAAGSSGGTDAARDMGATAGGGGGAGTDAARDVGGSVANLDGPRSDGSSAPVVVSPMMSFFVSSKGSGKGGNYNGLDGADAHCKALATAVSAALGAKTWHAYLSTSTVDARSRIGMGPWYNAKGEMIAKDLETLHMQAMDSPLNETWPVGDVAFEKILDEKGASHRQAQGTVHDILTGTNMAGTVDGSNHCNNWTSEMGMATVGHSNRSGGGRPPSWTTAHQSGCGSELDANGVLRNNTAGSVTQGGGRGSIYCFAVTP